MGAIRQRGRRRAAERRDRSAGFAAIDALVALTILSTTLVLSLQAVSTVRKTTDAASEARRAEALLDYLMASDRPRTGEWQGAGAGLEWRLAIQPNDVASGTVICRRQAEARSEKSNRRYALSTLEPCPIEGLG